MANLFFRTNLTPYRIDTYNALHKQYGCELFFYWNEEYSQKMNMQELKHLCNFTPHILNGFVIKSGKKRRKICTEIWQILSKNNPEFVIVPEFQIITLQVLLFRFFFRCKFKIISMCDDSYDMIVNHNDFSLIHRIGRKFVTPLIDDIILVDSRVVEWYKRKYGKGFWLPIIRNEIHEKDKYRRLLPLSNKLREQYRLNDKKVVLYVGRLVDIKNVDRLIEAFRMINEDNVALVIVGNGKEEERLKSLCPPISKQIVFTGHLEGDYLYAWYNVGDVFCLPSYLEPYGAVTNEALLSGCRVVVSEKAGSACIVDEHNGEIIDPFNISELAAAIERQLQKCAIRDKISYRKNLMNIKFADRINCLSEPLFQ